METLSTVLLERSSGVCELCSSSDAISCYTVPPKTGNIDEESVVICQSCRQQIENADELDDTNWRFLAESMWSENEAVQVLTYKLFKRMPDSDWASNNISMMYLDESATEWANANDTSDIQHIDSNGHQLMAGDTVTLIQDLNVKGGGFTAKRGTAVRRIRLDPNDSNYIEGKVDGQSIAILTKFVKKQ